MELTLNDLLQKLLLSNPPMPSRFNDAIDRHNASIGTLLERYEASQVPPDINVDSTIDALHDEAWRGLEAKLNLLRDARVAGGVATDLLMDARTILAENERDAISAVETAEAKAIKVYRRSASTSKPAAQQSATDDRQQTPPKSNSLS